MTLRPGWGGEFVVLLDDVSDPHQAAKVAEKMLLQIAGTSQQFGAPHGVTASIGIGFYPQDGEDEKTLMMNADGAMYRAKQRDKNNFQFHSQNSALRSKTVRLLPARRITESPQVRNPDLN
jgi:diguanylate cyclase (GGDEF)-like protein